MKNWNFSIRRRVAARRSIGAAAVLYAGFAVFMLAWRYSNPIGEGPADLRNYLAARWIFWIITALLTVLAIWGWKAIGRELEALRKMRRAATRHS